MSVVDLPKLYTEEEVAAYLQVNPETVARERRRKRLGYTLVAKKIRFTAAHIEAYLRERECGTTSKQEKKTVSTTSAGRTPMGHQDAIRLANEVLSERT